MLDVDKLADTIYSQVSGLIERSTMSLIDRVAALESRMTFLADRMTALEERHASVVSVSCGKIDRDGNLLLIFNDGRVDLVGPVVQSEDVLEERLAAISARIPDAVALKEETLARASDMINETVAAYEVPEIDLSRYVTKDDNDFVLKSELPTNYICKDDMSDYARIEDIPADYARKEDIPTDYALKSDIPTDYARIEDIPVDYVSRDDLSSYALKEDIPVDYARIEDIPADYARKDDIPTDYARKEDIPVDYVSKDEIAGYARIEDIPTDYARKDDILDHVSKDEMSGYARKEDLPVDYARVEDIPVDYVSKEKLDEYARKEDIPVDYARKGDLDGYAALSSLDGYALKEDVRDYVRKDDIVGYVHKDDMGGYALKEDIPRVKSIVGARVNDDGELVIKLSDGDTVNVGRVVGRDGFGFDDVTVDDDDREFVLKFVRGEDVKEFVVRKHGLYYKGVWRSGDYVAGDCVSYGGSLWICQRDTEDKPETSDAWKLAVKKGRDYRPPDPKPSHVDSVRR
jgi:hypothetical protein